MSEANVVITGMMGSGKSSVAPLVAKALNRTLIDTDAEIEKRKGRSIAHIFEQEGEAAFRKAEAELCAELAARTNLVIATGGGFLVPLKAQHLMERHRVFCLDASLETLFERMRDSKHRPLLENLKSLFIERQGAYARILHHVDTNGKNVEAIAQEILERARFGFEGEQTHVVRMPQQTPYPIVVKRGCAFKVGEALKWLGVEAKRIIVISNEKLKSLYGHKLEAEWVLIPDGEQHKTLSTVQDLYEKLLALKAKRDDVIVAFGGGVVGDVAGFVAATYMRGLRFVQIPSTLLAMVDSSIGGKTGVDLPQGKNLIGAFKQPLMVLTDPDLLDSLANEERVAGMAEVIKGALIGDIDLFKRIEGGAALDEYMILDAQRVKALLVEEDPFEHGNRALLNLGHTFGHAIEQASSYGMRHGEAVAIGLVAACELSVRLKLCPEELKHRVARVLKRVGLPTALHGLSVDAVFDGFKHDKKSTALGLRFVLPHDVGDVRLHEVRNLDLVRDVLNSIGA